MSYEKHGRGFIAQNLVHNFLIKKGYQVLTEDTTQGLIPTLSSIMFFPLSISVLLL